MSRALSPEAIKFAEKVKQQNPHIEEWLEKLGEDKVIKRQSTSSIILQKIREFRC